MSELIPEIPEPLNRPDGRHWCNPASATGPEAQCPQCGLLWALDATGVWHAVDV